MLHSCIITELSIYEILNCICFSLETVDLNMHVLINKINFPLLRRTTEHSHLKTSIFSNYSIILVLII